MRVQKQIAQFLPNGAGIESSLIITAEYEGVYRYDELITESVQIISIEAYNDITGCTTDITHIIFEHFDCVIETALALNWKEEADKLTALTMF